MVVVCSDQLRIYIILCVTWIGRDFFFSEISCCSARQFGELLTVISTKIWQKLWVWQSGLNFHQIVCFAGCRAPPFYDGYEVLRCQCIPLRRTHFEHAGNWKKIVCNQMRATNRSLFQHIFGALNWNRETTRALFSAVLYMFRWNGYWLYMKCITNQQGSVASTFGTQSRNQTKNGFTCSDFC